MSYSYSVPADHDLGTLPEKIDVLNAALPDGPGKDEAVASRSLMIDTIEGLASQLGAEDYTASVSGHRNGDSQVSLNVSVSKAVATE